MFKKLYSYGIRGSTLEIIKSYMRNRKHYVDISDTFSDEITNMNPFSVQQGSNLGPLLFLIYINDIFSIKLHGSLILFADDAMITYDANTTNELKKKMQHDLKIIYNWFRTNKLTMNIKKTKSMIIAPNNSELMNYKLDLQINNLGIEQVEHYKYLGLTIQNDFKWNIQINIIKRKVSAMSGVVKRMGNRVNHSTLKMIYFAYIHSQLTYLAPIWGLSAPSYLLKSLQVSQNNALRNIFTTDYLIENLHTNEIYKKYKILKIKDIIEYGSTLLIYQIINKETKTNIHIERIRDTQSYDTRHANNLRINNYRTNIGKTNVIRSSSVIYNRIVTDNDTNLNYKQFKNVIKIKILTQ